MVILLKKRLFKKEVTQLKGFMNIKLPVQSQGWDQFYGRSRKN